MERETLFKGIRWNRKGAEVILYIRNVDFCREIHDFEKGVPVENNYIKME